jgi:hypothetical protein
MMMWHGLQARENIKRRLEITAKPVLSEVEGMAVPQITQ